MVNSPCFELSSWKWLKGQSLKLGLQLPLQQHLSFKVKNAAAGACLWWMVEKEPVLLEVLCGG